MDYQWNFGAPLAYGKLWFQGVATTGKLSALVVVLGSVLGTALVVGLKSPTRGVRLVCRFYVDVFRAIPALVLIGTLYFCLPIIVRARIDPFQAALVALTLNLAPFAAECIRSGIDSVSTIQYDSARVMGFTGWKAAYYIIGPQAVRRIIPPLMGEYITTLKLTSLAATIGVPEIWHVAGQIVTATSLPLEARIFAALLYVAIILPFLWGSLWVERKFKVKGFGMAMER
jgi:His/Glu/Gln/Arg/opine family amino acid ABC transporter permease subunit